MLTDQLVLLPSKSNKASMSILIADKRDTATVKEIEANVKQVADKEKFDFDKVWERLTRRECIRVWLDRAVFEFDSPIVKEMWSKKFYQFESIKVSFGGYKNMDGPGVGLRMISYTKVQE